MAFSVHGKVHASYDKCNNILHIHIVTPVNKEFFAEYESILTPLRKSITAPKWASIVFVKGEALAPPEATPMMKKSIQQAISEGILATAIIFEENESKSISKDFWDRIYNDSGLKHDFFDNEEQATKWLLTLL